MSEEWIRPPRLAPLGGDEPFRGLEATVRDFWAFAMSDLRTNNVRGYLAEFLVAKAVGAGGFRIEWDAYDVLTPDGVRIEVKSAGYLQTWDQRRLSRISFGSMKGRTWSVELGQSASATLNADVYVFAVQTAVQHESYDPLDISQWQFYILSRDAVQATGYASIRLSTLHTLSDGAVPYDALAGAIRAAASGRSADQDERLDD